MWATILSWFFGGGLSKIGQIGVDLYKTKLSAENSTESYVATLAQKSMDLDAREADLNNKLLVSEQGNWMTRSIRPLWSAPFVIYTWKVVVWDVCLGWGTTEALQGAMSNLMLTVAGAYFGMRGIEKIVATWAGMRRAVTGARK